MIKSKDKIQNYENFVFYLAKRYFKFLLKNNRQDIQSIANSADFIISGGSIKDASRLIQRKLYRLAKENGWRKTRAGKWIHPEKRFSERLERIL